MANGDLIKQVREQLNNPKGLTAKAAQVLTLSLLADLYDKWEADHVKVEEMYANREDAKKDHDRVEKMWPISQVLIWVGGILGLANLTFLWAVLTHAVTITR